VSTKRALTLYLNAEEIVTIMTINDYPESGNRLPAQPEHAQSRRRNHRGRVRLGTIFEQKLKKRTLTSGRAEGTAFGDLMATVHGILIGCLYLPNGNPAPWPKFDGKANGQTLSR
jgi:FdhD protein